MRSPEAVERRKIYDRNRKRGVPENRAARWTPEQKAHAVARDRDARHWKDAYKFYLALCDRENIPTTRQREAS